jgi:hypothetical protein
LSPAERRAFNGAPRARVSIDIGTADPLFTVRPFRRRKTYSLPLSTVAQIVILRVILAEQNERRRARGKRGRR